MYTRTTYHPPIETAMPLWMAQVKQGQVATSIGAISKDNFNRRLELKDAHPEQSCGPNLPIKNDYYTRQELDHELVVAFDARTTQWYHFGDEADCLGTTEYSFDGTPMIFFRFANKQALTIAALQRTVVNKNNAVFILEKREL